MTTSAPIDRLELLLMRVVDGEATPAEAAELAGLADSDRRLAALGALGRALRSAVLGLAGDPVDVAGAVLEALGLDEGWATISAALRAETGSRPPDLAAAIMESVAAEERQRLLSALHDGELRVERRLELAAELQDDEAGRACLNRWADLGRLLRESIADQARPVDLAGTWAAVAREIGIADPEEVPGWERVGRAVRDAVASAGAIDEAEAARMSAAVMDALPVERKVLPLRSMPRGTWRRWLGLAPVLAAAVALLLVVRGPGSTLPQVEPGADTGIAAAAATPGAEVEDIQVADGVLVQVIQGENEAPLMIMIDDSSFEGPGDEGAAL